MACIKQVMVRLANGFIFHPFGPLGVIDRWFVKSSLNLKALATMLVNNVNIVYCIPMHFDHE